MEALLSKTRSLNLLAKGFGALNSNQIRGYNVSKYVTVKKRIARNLKNESSLNWTKTLFDGLERLKSLDLSEPHMLHVVFLRATTRGRPWWEKQIIEELGFDGKLSQPVILKNIPGVNQMLDEVKHLLVVQPLKLPYGLPNHPKEFETLTLKSNGELVFQKHLDCHDSDEKGEGKALEEAQVQDAGKLGPEWTFTRETLQKQLDRSLQIYQVNLEQFDTKYEYKRNQDGSTYRQMSRPTRKVIVDGDPGTDDAKAILLLLKDPCTHVMAITVTQGNTTLLNASRNAMRILAMAGRNDIPVYAGSTRSILAKKVKSDFYFGTDGMGDTVTEYDNDLGKLQNEKAVPALIRMVDENRDEVTMICLGPLTNIALAMEIDNRFGGRLKACYIMGGNYMARGNITPASEFNFYRDPEAAHIVMKGLSCPITLITWELCLSLNLTWDWYHKITNKNTKYSRFLKLIGAEMAKNAKDAGLKNYVLADELAAACFIDNNIIVESEEIVCEVELNGYLTRGQMVVDWKSSANPDAQKNIRLVKKIDVEMFKALMENMTS